MWTVPKPKYRPGSTEGKITVNIGGVRVVLFEDALSRYPESRLAELLARSTQNYEGISSLCDDFDPGRKEFYFDRDPDAFKCIVDVYYFDEIHIKNGICPICFIKEMEFWQIDQSVLDECCKSYLSEKEDELKEISGKVKVILEDLQVERCVTRGQKCQRLLWRLMEKPGSSLAARVIAIASFLSVLVSAVVMCVGTIPELQVPDAEGKLVEHPALDAVETACMAWFTAEYALRLASSPDKLHFATSVMNVIDFMAIVPFYVVLSLTYLGTASMMELATVQQAVQALRILRIARVFKLARHSAGLQTLTYALKRSLKELGLLLMYMGVGIFVFSALAYTMEQSHPETLFKSIPQSFWWAIITMTTVGYGDIYPKTTLGKCNAAVSFLCGVIAIALPIHPIINNFVIFYNKQRVLEIAAKREVELMEMKSNPKMGRRKSKDQV
ncbi:voltage-gated potassium channel regulatory subunit KCNF1 [Eucyclogobius newberryi]|uniref:voltage-gated potassium channel regulatory subunit KCNF1 n=1 Tax=Eucyclogobius newberryi TaxID=166745 RepID=UPI003B598406